MTTKDQEDLLRTMVTQQAQLITLLEQQIIAVGEVTAAVVELEKTVQSKP